MAWSKRNSRRLKSSQIVLSLVLLALLVITGISIWYFNDPKESQPSNTVESPVQIEAESTENNQPTFDSRSLQAVIDTWVADQSGTSSVVVSDEEGNVLAAYNADQVYFAASLYKLFVAYEGYRQIDEGDVNPNEQYLNGNTRLQCLDLMIRESNSPCGEKLWTELGKLELTNRLREYGITNTSMVQISTTAKDASMILSRIATGEGLSVESQSAFLDSMNSQPDLYRRGFPSGFSNKLNVYNKVGWNELVEWHDASIIELPDGRKAIVAVLTKNVGSKSIAELARLLEPTLLQ